MRRNAEKSKGDAMVVVVGIAGDLRVWGGLYVCMLHEYSVLS